MDGSGFPHFPGNLDPRAQEFIPGNYISSFPLLPPPPLYCPYPLPPPPLPSPPAYHHHPFPPPPPPPQPAYVSMTLPPPPMSVPSRALLVSMVPPDVSESIIRRDLEVFGDVRAVQMEKVKDGIVTVHFYDMRQARRALVAIQEQNMHQQCRLRRQYEEFVVAGLIYPPPVPPPGPGLIAGHVVWAQFTVPLASSMPHGNNQGTLVIFNLDPEVPSTHLKQLFEAFGTVKELRETPLKKHQRFVEFYDIRDAASAMAGMNGKEIHGKQIVIEYSRPGGQCKKLSKTIRNNPSRNSLTISWNNYPNDNHSPRPLRITPRSPPTPPSPRRPKTWGSSVTNASNVPNSKPSDGFRGNLKGNHCARSSSSSSGNGNEEFAISSSLYPSNVKGFGKVKSNASTSRPRQPQPKTGGTKPWKDFRVSKDFNPRFLIDGDAIVDSNCRDSRTTVMIKNIPNKYSQKLLLNMMDNHCIHCNEQIADGDDQPLSSYDFLYLPIDFVNKCNVGYGFVNMTSPEATWRLYKAFHRQTWEVFNSRKICEVTYARLQGLEALKEHFKNSRFLCDSDEFMPVIFQPPRDGRLLTEPVPVFSRSSLSPPPLLECLSLSSKDASEDGETSGGSSQKQQEEEDESAGRVNGSPNSSKTDRYEDFNHSRGGSINSNGGESGEYYQGDGIDDDDDVNF